MLKIGKVQILNPWLCGRNCTQTGVGGFGRADVADKISLQWMRLDTGAV